MSTKTTTRPIQKGISIASFVEGGSSSSTKPKRTEGDSGKGKEILIEKSKDEKKAEIEAEMEKQRQIQIIWRLRENDPPNIDKGDPKKLHSYEHIKARVSYNQMYAFKKKCRRSYFI